MRTQCAVRALTGAGGRGIVLGHGAMVEPRVLKEMGWEW